MDQYFQAACEFYTLETPKGLVSSRYILKIYLLLGLAWTAEEEDSVAISTSQTLPSPLPSYISELQGFELSLSTWSIERAVNAEFR